MLELVWSLGRQLAVGCDSFFPPPGNREGASSLVIVSMVQEAQGQVLTLLGVMHPFEMLRKVVVTPPEKSALCSEVIVNFWGCSWKPPQSQEKVSRYRVFNLLTEKSQAQRGPDAAWHTPGIPQDPGSWCPDQQGGYENGLTGRRLG